MPSLLISLLFFVIHASVLCTASDPTSNSCYYLHQKCSVGNGTLPQSLTIIKYGENLTSEGEGRFQLGFFGNRSSTYLGIWYSGTNPKVIVWVANGNKPISSQRQQGCSLVMANDGNAKLLDSRNQSYWSTRISPSNVLSTDWKLLDNGNLILVNNIAGNRTSGINRWESFKHPTDTLLPGMADITKSPVKLTSWRSPEIENQAQGGYYVFQAEIRQSSLSLSIYPKDVSIPYWLNSSSVPDKLTSLLLNNMTGNSSLRLVMTAWGSIQLWEQRGEKWSRLWFAPADQCDLYHTCGSNAVCDAGNSFKCKCLPGFKPDDPDKWESGFSSGVDCSRKTSTPSGQVFLKLPMIKVPSNPDSYGYSITDEKKCRDECTSDSTCKAYSFDPVKHNCLTWTKNLEDIQEEYYNDSNQTLYVRVASSDIALGSRTCKICGTNVIPYPLSTKAGCGDPAYSSFQCNDSNGQVYFKAPSEIPYKVSHINPDQRKLVIQLSENTTCDATNIESKVLNLNNSLSFKVTNCNVVDLIERRVVEVVMNWTTPPQPACNSSANCSDWPHTTCRFGADGKKACTCGKGFYWNPLSVNCTQVDHRHISLWLKAVIAIASGTVLLLLSIILFILHLRRTRATQREGIVDFRTDDMVDIDIPFVDYESILAATDNFSDANKLGAGGFGPVYKGKLADGNEIAVKRLSAASAQGNVEFRNEVVLIAKLQHRNLVRVIGYCVREDEKILIYEYMPNKSLDSFLFDHTISPSLDWKKRFNIIMGVARGLLYLHHDSRLRIIHRDLKPSNILLDEELNPKISDFGLARIVGGKETATNTATVVGTYGYMAPEYALDGCFSVKSDVYSFGILVLEVVSGKRCTSLLRFDDILKSLLGYAWTLWDTGKALELVDESIIDSYDNFEVKRCINVGLLCVQEDPGDRPTMLTVLLMLGGDNMNLPYPKQPVFVARRPPAEIASSSSTFGASSNVELTTTAEGR